MSNRGKSESGTNTRDFVIGAIVGAVAGAAATLFLTPRSGKELRSSINEQTISILEKTDKVKNKAMTKSTELVSVAKEKASTLAHTVSQQSNDLLHKVKSQDEANFDETKAIVQDSLASGEIQRKLEETQKAFDETEQKLNQ